MVGVAEFGFALLKGAVAFELNEIVLLDHDDVRGRFASCPAARLNVADEVLEGVEAYNEIACWEVEALFRDRCCDH